MRTNPLWFHLHRPLPLTVTSKVSILMDPPSCGTPAIRTVCFLFSRARQQQIPLDLTRKFNTGLSPEVDEIVSLFKNKSGSRQPLNLERYQAQEYANTLNAVGISQRQSSG